MKKIILVIVAIHLSLFTLNCKADETYVGYAKPITNITYLDAKSDQAIIDRINEIKAMDKSKLSFTERKELRKELRATKKYLEMRGGGVYLSVGAVIIIVLLLILIL
jgi:uncharacterized protein YnzC (UPF0291/DUF896 family)